MPELPEVQTIVDDLIEAHLIGRTIKQARVYWPKTVGSPDLSIFLKEISNKKITDLKRRGKYLVFYLSQNFYLIIHLRMTGRLLFVPTKTEHSIYVQLTLQLDQEQEIRFHDTRKFGRFYLTSDLEAFFKKLGPEPLDYSFSLSQFTSMLKNKTRALKPLLLDQSFLAGLGNIYVDEALWRAQLHPLRKANSLNKQEIQHLHEAIIFVLQRGINSRGTTLGSGRTNYYRLNGQQGKHQTLLQVFRRTGQPCERCNQPIQRIIVAQRSTHICPQCQSPHNEMHKKRVK